MRPFIKLMPGKHRRVKMTVVHRAGKPGHGKHREKNLARKKRLRAKLMITKTKKLMQQRPTALHKFQNRSHFKFMAGKASMPARNIITDMAGHVMSTALRRYNTRTMNGGAAPVSFNKAGGDRHHVTGRFPFLITSNTSNGDKFNSAASATGFPAVAINVKFLSGDTVVIMSLYSRFAEREFDLNVNRVRSNNDASAKGNVCIGLLSDPVAPVYIASVNSTSFFTMAMVEASGNHITFPVATNQTTSPSQMRLQWKDNARDPKYTFTKVAETGVEVGDTLTSGDEAEVRQTYFCALMIASEGTATDGVEEAFMDFKLTLDTYDRMTTSSPPQVAQMVKDLAYVIMRQRGPIDVPDHGLIKNYLIDHLRDPDTRERLYDEFLYEMGMQRTDDGDQTPSTPASPRKYDEKKSAMTATTAAVSGVAAKVTPIAQPSTAVAACAFEIPSAPLQPVGLSPPVANLQTLTAMSYGDAAKYAQCKRSKSVVSIKTPTQGNDGAGAGPRPAHL